MEEANSTESVAGNIRVLMITSEFPTIENPAAVPFIARQVDFLRRAGVDVDVFHFHGRKNPLNYFRAWRRLRRRTSGKEYDLVHAQWGQSATLAMPKRRPLVITFRGNDLEGIIGKNGRHTLLGELQRVVSKCMAVFADEVIVVSESLTRHIRRRDFTVIPSGLDFELFRPIPRAEARSRLDLPRDKQLVLFAASTIDNPRKRFDLAREAVERLDHRLNAELIVATRVPHREIPYFMGACNALLLTSVHEGSPNVVKEALACNLPVVSVNVGDVSRRISGIAGCEICADDSSETIASALERVLLRDERIDGRTTILDLDERHITRKVLSVYRNALEKAGKTRAIYLKGGDDEETAY